MSDDKRGFSAAVSQKEFEKMMVSPVVDVLDWTEIGPMGEFDIYLSFQVTEDERDIPEPKDPADKSPAEAAFGHVSDDVGKEDENVE